MKNKIITIVFIAYLFLFAIGTLALKDREFSDMENRNLEQCPEITMNSLANGSFMDRFETYFSDQVIFKDDLVKLKTTSTSLMNQTYSNGVFLTDSGRLIQEYNNPYNQLNINLNYINEFANLNTDLNCSWLLAPNACYIYEDELPAFADVYSQQEVISYVAANVSSNVDFIDVSDELLAEKDLNLYYYTDHHWTMDGAYIAYRTYCEEKGMDAVARNSYNIEKASTDFYGSLYSKAPVFNQRADEILLYNNPDGEYLVEYLDEGVTLNSLYNYDNLEIKDKYTTYLDGNHSIIKINSNCSSGKELLVVKDSYAHSLLPLLADNYSVIYVVDLRYYHQSVSDLARELNISEILFINNVDFISTDNNFLWLY